MVQHDLDGNLQFLHRTYLGKFDPASSEPWREMDFVTNPVSPEQAILYSEVYGFFPHQVSTDFEKYCCSDGSHTAAANECNFKECRSPGSPLPLLTVAVANLEPQVQTVLDALNDLYADLRSTHASAAST